MYRSPPPSPLLPPARISLLIAKVGPGSYSPARSVEYGKFHREVSALMPRRDEGTIRRATVDLNNLFVYKSSKKLKKSKELPTSHLGTLIPLFFSFQCHSLSEQDQGHISIPQRRIFR
jgi:hypothetical protein